MPATPATDKSRERHQRSSQAIDESHHERGQRQPCQPAPGQPRTRITCGSVDVLIVAWDCIAVKIILRWVSIPCAVALTMICVPFAAATSASASTPSIQVQGTTSISGYMIEGVTFEIAPSPSDVVVVRLLVLRDGEWVPQIDRIFQ